MKLRLTNRTTTGGSAVTLWSFDPLLDTSDKPDRLILRRSGRGANANMHSKPLTEQFAIRVTFGADCLTSPLNYANFELFLQADKIEIAKTVAGKEKFTEYVLPPDEKLTMERLEEVAMLVFKEFELTEAKARWYYKAFKS